MAKKAAGVSGEQLAKLLNLDVRRVQQLAKLEGMPKLAHGRYDPQECVLWYVRYLQQVVAKRGAEPDPGKIDEKERLIRLTADIKELEKGKLLAQLVTLDDYRAALSDVVQRIDGRLRNVETSYAHRILNIADPGDARKVLRDIVLELRAELRRVRLPGEPEAPAA